MTQAPARMTDAQLAELTERLRRWRGRPSGEGAEAWYARDVPDLLNEVLALRHERAEALGMLASVFPVEASGSLSVAVDAACDLWQQQMEGLYAEQEVARLRKQIDRLEGDLQAQAQEQAKFVDTVRRVAGELLAVAP